MSETYERNYPGFSDHDHRYGVQQDEDGTMRLVFPEWPCDCPCTTWLAWRKEVAASVDEIDSRTISMADAASDWSDSPFDGPLLRRELGDILFWSRALASLLDAEPPRIRPEVVARDQAVLP